MEEAILLMEMAVMEIRTIIIIHPNYKVLIQMTCKMHI